MKINKFTIYILLSFLIFSITKIKAQSGDQILDGIGETGLIARYIFNGNVKDWSRNNLHAKIQGSKAEFINDDKFGQVLSLPASSNTYISIPSETVEGEESLSIMGWVYLRSKQKDQLFFDFGKNEDTHLFIAPTGNGTTEKLVAAINVKSENKSNVNSESIEINKWNHLSIVIDVPSKSIRLYINGTLINSTNNLELELEQLFGTNSSNKNKLYIGKSLLSEHSSLDAMLYDFRIYRIPISDKQAGIIYRNSLISEGTVVREKFEPENDLPKFQNTTPQLYNKYLINISNIEVETVKGTLPRLPRYIDGIYQEGIEGPKVRVIWPTPRNNDNVLKTGTYSVIGTIPGTNLKPKATVIVKETSKVLAPTLKLEGFNLNQVTLNLNSLGQKTKFIENRDKFIETLANTNPDDFLYMFRNTYGQQQPEGAKPLGVWDSQETKLRGHATGHYLTAIAQAYASSKYDKSLQENFANKMEYLVNTLFELSKMSGQPKESNGTYVSDPTAVPTGPGKSMYDSDLSVTGIRTDYWNWGKGFISAYPPDQFIMLESGATYGGQNTQIWAPYYTLHKILAGLMDIYEVNGNEKALKIAEGMGSWVHARLSKLPTKTLISMWNSYIAGEFGGMNEAMARLYRLTSKKEYLNVAQSFDNIKMFFGDANHSHGLAKNVDTFRGLHANQHIPQIVGALEMYRNSKTSEYYNIANNFWYKIVNDYMYSIGGVAGARNPANAECFTKEPATIYENGLSTGGQNETCATYNMLKLTKNLFLYNQHPELMDYYERGLYNQILASVAENSSANTYHIPLRPGSVKHFSNPNMEGFTCCNGTALESSTKLQNSIYFKDIDNQGLYINLYVPSVLNWSERNIIVEQKTTFPNEDHTQLTIKGKGKFELNLRVPHWATKGFFVSINGKKQTMKAKPGSYLTLGRKWKNGDIIEIQMPFTFHLDPVMDQQNIASLFYGPILLAAQEIEPRKEWRKISLDAKDISKSIKGNPKKLEFTIDGVVFKPFYETYGRHSVYMDVTLK